MGVTRKSDKSRDPHHTPADLHTERDGPGNTSRSVTCPDCPFQAKSQAGLSAHRRRAHRDEKATGPNVAAISETLSELKRLGRLEKIDAARVQALRSMAGALDQNPFNSQMWREYREAIEVLTADDSDPGSIDDLLDELSAPVRDQTKT